MKNGLYQNDLGIKIWYKDGQIHRVNGPADVWIGDWRFFSINGFIHRINAPAKINRYGIIEWWINGINITEKLINYCKDNNINIIDYQNLERSDKLKLKIKFGLLL